MGIRRPAFFFLLLLLLCRPPAAPAEGAVILRYERLAEDPGDPAAVAIEDFDQHLAWLAEEQYSIWPVEKIIAHLGNGLPLPERCAALTFDGATRSVYDVALPRLQAKGWPFTLFVSIEPVDLHEPGFLTWDELRELRKAGAKIGNQTDPSRHLVHRGVGERPEEWAARVTEEIHYCRARLFEQLGQANDIVAYPFGEYDAALRELILKLKMTGLGLQPGAIGPGSDFGALPRFAMAGENAMLDEFVRRVRSLAFPILAAEPVETLLAPQQTQPVLRLTLAPGDYDAEALAGSVRGPDDLLVRWIDREQGVIELVAREPLPAGRSVYTLMAPHKDGGRYFWYSRIWIVGMPEEE
jgi:peptidoglycan/xylan/chitin deacetylase (PgdA/CDA1 family)